jgi:hypothetical protein
LQWDILLIILCEAFLTCILWLLYYITDVIGKEWRWMATSGNIILLGLSKNPIMFRLLSLLHQLPPYFTHHHLWTTGLLMGKTQTKSKKLPVWWLRFAIKSNLKWIAYNCKFTFTELYIYLRTKKKYTIVYTEEKQERNNHESWSLDQNLNPRPLEYEAVVLPHTNSWS